MSDVTRRTFNAALIGGAAVAAASPAQACVSLRSVAAEGLAMPHDDELARLRHLMATLEDMTDRLRYLEPRETAAARRDLLSGLRETTEGAAATLERMRLKLDAELALAMAGDKAPGSG